MHNGEIRGFSQIKRNLRRSLSDETYEWIEGETDSEHFFALFLNRLLKKNNISGVRFLSDTLIETIDELEVLKTKHDVQQASSLNIVITDGSCLVGVRYISKGYEKIIPPTLYYSSGKLCTCDNGISHMESSSCDKAVLVVSEKLTDYQDEWNEVPPNHLIEVDNLLSVSIKSLSSF
jgi:predicted glutamine amidotransferase